MSEAIDVSRVERELVDALAADRKYARENDAKIRAVSQRVATYEEFREIVKGSHLKPLEQKDTRGGGGGFRQPWNTAVHEGNSRDGDRGKRGGVGLGEGCGTTPLNGQMFARDWRRLKSQPSDQYRFLLDVGRERLLQLFKVEISMGLLGEMLAVMNKYLQNGDTETVLGILDALAQSSRFKLSIDFLSRAEKQTSEELFAKLWESIAETQSTPTGSSQAHLNQLTALYGHTPSQHAAPSIS